MTAIADALLHARRTDTPLAYSPALAVADLDAAYAVQAEVAAGLHAEVAGWKVGFAPDRTPFAAPIFRADVRPDGAAWRLGNSPLKIEIELAIRLGRDLPRAPMSREALVDSIADVFPGIEFVQARFADADSVPVPARIADNFANLGYVEGAPVKAFRDLALDRLRVRVWENDDLRQDGIGTHLEGDPLKPVLAWIAVAADRFGGLKAGQFITTGTLTTPFDVATACAIRGAIDGVGEVTASLVR